MRNSGAIYSQKPVVEHALYGVRNLACCLDQFPGLRLWAWCWIQQCSTYAKKTNNQNTGWDSQENKKLRSRCVEVLRMTYPLLHKKHNLLLLIKCPVLYLVLNTGIWDDAYHSDSDSVDWWQKKSRSVGGYGRDSAAPSLSLARSLAPPPHRLSPLHFLPRVGASKHTRCLCAGDDATRRTPYVFFLVQLPRWPTAPPAPSDLWWSDPRWPNRRSNVTGRHVHRNFMKSSPQKRKVFWYYIRYP